MFQFAESQLLSRCQELSGKIGLHSLTPHTRPTQHEIILIVVQANHPPLHSHLTAD